MAEREDAGPLPERATMGLLDYITAHSLDEDYAHVSARRRVTSDGPETSQGRRLPTVIVLVAFGLLVATAGIQTARTEPVRRSSQESLATQVTDRRAELADVRAEVLRLREQVERGQDAALETSEAGRALSDEVTALGVAAGTEPVTGPGVRIEVDDSPDAASDRQIVLDTDLQKLVNGLWASGAEAISVNGQRLTARSAIRVAGEAITVNLRSLSRPYVVNAIGDPDQLAARLLDSEAGTWWLNLRSVYDLQFEMTTEESLIVPAAPDLDLRHARPTTRTPAPATGAGR
jgi:uncharacterized protein YlxW (UPF0749 family)